MIELMTLVVTVAILIAAITILIMLGWRRCYKC
jgi:hypothetical protein